MTTIFWHENRLYADSNVVQGSDTYQSLTKINQLTQPLRIACDKPKIKDTIYGWIASGAMVPAQKFMVYLDRFRQLDDVLTMYSFMESAALLNFENSFEVILIGRKANYSVNIGLDRPGDPTRIYKHEDRFALGSGSSALKALWKQCEGIDPIRAMYAVYLKDEMSRGLIDVWELKYVGNRATFQRIGICRGIEDRPLSELISDMRKPYPFDWELTDSGREVKPRPVKKVKKSNQV